MKETMLFNPLIAPNPEGLGAILPNRRLGIPSWSTHADSWWAGATIGYPDLKGSLDAYKNLKKIRELTDQLQRGDRRAGQEIHELYVDVTQSCRNNLLKTLSLNDSEATVILETSGSSALALMRNLLHFSEDEMIVTTTEGGNLVKPILMGRDPWNYPSSAFYENVQLYTHHRGISHPQGDTNKVISIDVWDEKGWKPNKAIVDEVRTLLSDGRVACLVIPLATKTGRLLPVKEIGTLVKTHNESGNYPVTYIIDAIQALGRTTAEAVTRPLDYCDAFICSSSKALGGILIAAAVVAKPELVRTGLPHLLNSSYERHLRFYQFDPRWSNILNPVLHDRHEHQAISLPEIASFNRVLESHLKRGDGNNYVEQRENQMEKIRQYRQLVISALKGLSQLEVFEGKKESPVTSSIITFRLNPGVKISPRALKQKLQDSSLGPIVTPCAPVGSLLRLEIPEHRPVPSLDKLIQKLSLVLEG
jgi:hypothetical protein